MNSPIVSIFINALKGHHYFDNLLSCGKAIGTAIQQKVVPPSAAGRAMGWGVGGGPCSHSRGRLQHSAYGQMRVVVGGQQGPTGAGRWAETSSGARGLPYKPPARVRTAARRDEPEGTSCLPCWPCRAAAAAAVRTGIAKALRARPPLGQRSSPRRRRPLREGPRARQHFM